VQQLNLRGNGGGQQEDSVKTKLKVRDENQPGDYLYVDIQVCDFALAAESV
jgi:hypothetical protein